MFQSYQFNGVTELAFIQINVTHRRIQVLMACESLDDARVNTFVSEFREELAAPAVGACSLDACKRVEAREQVDDRLGAEAAVLCAEEQWCLLSKSCQSFFVGEQ